MSRIEIVRDLVPAVTPDVLEKKLHPLIAKLRAEGAPATPHPGGSR